MIHQRGGARAVPAQPNGKLIGTRSLRHKATRGDERVRRTRTDWSASLRYLAQVLHVDQVGIP